MFEIAAHRGGNSWFSIQDAIREGYDYIELDVHLSKDGFLIVQYSPYVKISTGEVLIENLEYNYLSQEDRACILLLDDVFSYVKGKLNIVVDIKKGKNFYYGIGAITAKLVKQHCLIDYVWLISFDHLCLKEAKLVVPEIKIAPMYVARPYDEVSYWNGINSDGIEICNDYLTRQIVELAHSNNLVLIGWCTRNLQELDWLVDIGIDIITIEQEEIYKQYLFKKRDEKYARNY